MEKKSTSNMILPVSNPAFWKSRLTAAKANGKLHFSVYLARQPLWDNIERAHKEILLKETDPDFRVLDAGCGYGRLSPLWKDYTGVDISPDLLAEARALNPSKNFIEGNLKKLPFKDGEFDVAFCSSIMNMIVGNLGSEAWAEIEHELKRVADKLLILEYENPDEYFIL